MGKFLRAKVLLAILLALAVFLSACASDDGGGESKQPDKKDRTDTARPDVTELVAQGKSYLAQLDTKNAWETFDRVCELRGDLPDGHLGIYLSDEIILVDWLQSLVEALSNFLNGWLSKGSDKVAGDVVHDIIENFAQPLADEMVEHLEQIKGDFSFYLPSYPLLRYDERVVCDLGGEWDQSDALIVRGGARAFLGMMDLLLAYDLDFDVGHLVDIAIPPDADLRETLLILVNAFLAILNDPDYPDFLYLYDDGFTLQPQAGVEMGRGLLDIVSGFASVLNETDPQSDDIVGYIDENHNSKWDSGEPLVLPYIRHISNDQAAFTWSVLNIIDLAGRSMLDGTEYDTSPDPNLFPLVSINPLFETLGFPPLLPDVSVDLGKFYREPSHEGLHDALVAILNLLKQILEGTP